MQMTNSKWLYGLTSNESRILINVHTPAPMGPVGNRFGLSSQQLVAHQTFAQAFHTLELMLMLMAGSNKLLQRPFVERSKPPIHQGVQQAGD
jgi:hypothetical protein